MKKLILSLFFFILLSTHTYALAPQDLKFTPQGEGKFIYCNNDEAIWRKDLSDTSSPNPMYIMNNDDLETGKYAMFVSHVNHTEKQSSQDSTVTMGFDIEVDVQLVAKENTKLVIGAIGFEVLRVQTFQDKDRLFKMQSPWDFAQAVADYKQIPIYTKDTAEKYIPAPFKPIQLTLKAGETVWLSEYIQNYSSVPCLKFVHILSDFEILEGSLDVNVAALRHNGKLKDRSHHSPDAKRGIYYRDKQYKGIADTLPTVYADLSFTIDDTIKSGTLLPVTVYNQYQPKGNTVEKWFTHINPQDDIWARDSSAESDMLSFSYYDEEKLKYYDASIPQNKRDAVWVFDVFHSDTQESEGGIPNYLLSTKNDNRGNSCNLGNYGVNTVYRVTVKNDGEKKRYFNYMLKSSSTNLVSIRDHDGKLIDGYMLRKKAVGKRVDEPMASIAIAPKKTVSFEIEVLLPANFAGGMENSFEIRDVSRKPAVYESTAKEIIEKYPHTGKEYYKWHDGRLYFSDDAVSWRIRVVPNSVKKIFEGNWNNYEIKHFDGGYTIRWKAYDESMFDFDALLKYCNKVYFLNERFSLVTTHHFDGYPSEISFADGKIVTKAGNRKYTTAFPNLEKTISVKLDQSYLDFDVAPIIVDGRTLVPIRTLFEALGANVEWEAKTRTATVTMRNQTVQFTVDQPVAYINKQQKTMDVPAMLYEGRTLVPLRFFSETLGYTVNWDAHTKTITILK